MKHKRIIASEGMVLTNGEVYGKEVFLGSGDSPERWTEITEAEHSEIQRRDCNAEDLY